MTIPSYKELLILCLNLVAELQGYKSANPNHDETLINQARSLISQAAHRKEYNISTTESKFLNQFYCNEEGTIKEVLTNPGKYLGLNWEKVLEFWCYLDTLTEEQLKVVYRRYFAVNFKERYNDWENAWESSKEFAKYTQITVYSSFGKLSWSHSVVLHMDWIVKNATDELIANVKNPVILPMFYNF